MPKAYLRLAGRQLLLHAAARLAAAAAPIARLQCVVVAHPDDLAPHTSECIVDLTERFGPDGEIGMASGGSTRQASMANGLALCAADADLVLVHDAARPFPPIEATRACIEAAVRTGAAILAVPAPDTIKRVDQGRIAATVDRSGLWLAQTPQVIRRDLLQRALAHAAATGFAGTDDVSLVEHLGEPVAVVPGSPTNLKITRPEDLPLAAAILAANLP